jgi:HlyD family secretion protein
MESKLRIKNMNLRKILTSLLILAVIAGGVFYYTQNVAAATLSDDTTVKTAKVRQGSITISVSGSGSLVATQESDLSFSTTDRVAKVNVAAGDVVKKGDVLAVLENLDQLQSAVSTAEQNLITAQTNLKTLKEKATANIANAQIAAEDAKKAVDTAESAVVEKGWVRCDQETTDAYYSVLMRAQKALDDMGDGGGNQDYYLKEIVPAKNAVAEAKAAWIYCAGYTNYEINTSQASLTLKQAELQEAQDTLNTLTQNNGLDPIELATAENAVTTAQVALDNAKSTLEGATLVAPFDGTIITVSGQASNTVDKNTTFITMSDLSNPQVEFSVDETDLDKVAVGEEATIVFDALPDLTYKGKVVRIYPALETSNGYQVVKGLIQLDLSQTTTSTSKLVEGLNGTVQMVQATAQNVLLVPVQAVHDLGDGTYSVFVVGANDKLEMKTVEIGLKDAASVEIKSGLTLGETVSTGTTQTK